jgi:ParB-like chromosome segregation protein Spo0J
MSDIDTYVAEVHPVASLFPPLPEDELQELADSIRAVGLDQPIVIDGEGRVLDGRNRLAACELAGVEPSFVTYQGADTGDFALRTNITRRHLSPGARAILVAQAARLSGQSTRQAAASVPDMGRGRIGEANIIIDHAPDLVPRVMAGAAFSRAYEEATARKKAGAAKEATVKRLTPELRALVEEGRLSSTDAVGALEVQIRKTAEDVQRQRENAEQRNEAFSKAVNRMHGLGKPGVRALVLESWRTGFYGKATPSDQEAMTAKNFRIVADGLRALADDSEKVQSE